MQPLEMDCIRMNCIRFFFPNIICKIVSNKTGEYRTLRIVCSKDNLRKIIKNINHKWEKQYNKTMGRYIYVINTDCFDDIYDAIEKNFVYMCLTGREWFGAKCFDDIF